MKIRSGSNSAKYRSLRETVPPIFYTADFGPKVYPDSFVLHVRTEGDPRAILEPVRKVLRSIDAQMPFYQTSTLAEEVDRSLWQERLVAALASCFGVFAMLLSGITLYSILAYFVGRRQREIGLRIALGAATFHIATLVAGRVEARFTEYRPWIRYRWLQPRP
jgi:putative ABC transport system permease protein